MKIKTQWDHPIAQELLDSLPYLAQRSRRTGEIVHLSNRKRAMLIHASSSMDAGAHTQENWTAYVEGDPQNVLRHIQLIRDKHGDVLKARQAPGTHEIYL